LRSLRSLHVHFGEHMRFERYAITAHALAALATLQALRELSIMHAAVLSREHPPYGAYPGWSWRPLGADAVSHDTLLQFAASMPRLRHMELMAPIALSEDYHASQYSRSVRRGAAVASFLPQLGALCPQLECLRLAMAFWLEGLAESAAESGSATATTSSMAKPVFPELRVLDVGVLNKCALVDDARRSGVRFSALGISAIVVHSDLRRKARLIMIVPNANIICVFLAALVCIK
jgi:hypothetical protein